MIASQDHCTGQMEAQFLHPQEGWKRPVGGTWPTYLPTYLCTYPQ